MDTNLPAQLVQFLMPFLPALRQGFKLAGEEAAKKFGEKTTDQGWRVAKNLWKKLRRNQKVTQAAQTAAAQPENAASREALRGEIARALKEDPTLQQEIARLMQDEVVQRVLAEGRNIQIRNPEQEASTGPTTQEVKARGKDIIIEKPRQIRKEK